MEQLVIRLVLFTRPSFSTWDQQKQSSFIIKFLLWNLTIRDVNWEIYFQVLALDKRFLDPRRTLNPSQAEKEEGIIPLTDSLPIISQVYFVSCSFFYIHETKENLTNGAIISGFSMYGGVSLFEYVLIYAFSFFIINIKWLLFR